MMVAEVKRLKGIINEMILLAKLDTEKAYNPELISGKEMIHSVLDRVIPLLNEHQVEVEKRLEENIHLYADEEKFLRALSNIVVNAIRHADSKIFIQVYQEQKKTWITIEDDGDGVDEELVPHIFHRFIKGKDGETGLGLAIARAIVEQSDGQIEVDRSPSLQGARFTITMPPSRKK
jgi:signal transduction histidine kinase